jgi:Fur family ferric uptake transcriptional regulator
METARNLRQQGHRLTPQRLAVLEAIKAGPGHMTANEVLERLRAQYPTLSIPTIYRNLQWLKEVELVAETDLGGGCHVYEYIADDQHHHLVCTRCQRVTDLPSTFLDPVLKAMHDEYGFVPSMKHVALFGLCPDCQRCEDEERNPGD